MVDPTAPGQRTPLRCEVRPATADRFDDVAAVLSPTGNPRACWCLAYREPSPADRRRLDDDRGAYVRELTARSPAPGLLAYVRGDGEGEGEVAGWCGLGPRDSMRRLRSSRTIPAVDDLPVWSVVCFVVLARYRRRGVATALLEAAVEHARSAGAPAIEGYPVEPVEGRLGSAAAFPGTVRLFEAAGFAKVAPTSSVSGGAPRWVVRRDLRD
ncbi:GNAT family N-acetyltransferase [Oerskovia flava]|uniref:GNAT family N-acetyltransferase n=1 Tax=Oerskovia flava TaxID=2986422 RepID=UPI002240700F|nr:GNAT family N-acetyltransferase [Oerskovia sp. JB1-3-2]